MADTCEYGNELDCSGSGYIQVAVTCECGLNWTVLVQDRDRWPSLVNVVMNWTVLVQDRDKWRVLVNAVMNWTVLVQDRDRWRSLVNAVMSLRVPQNAGNSLTS